MGRKSVKEMRDELSRHADELLGKVDIRDNTDCKRRFAELMSADPAKKSELDALMKQVDDSVPRSYISSEMRAKMVRLKQSNAEFEHMSKEYEDQKNWPQAVKKGMQDFVLKTHGSPEDRVMMGRVERVEKVAKGMMRWFAAGAPAQDAAAPKKAKAAVEQQAAAAQGPGKAVLWAVDMDDTIGNGSFGDQGVAANVFDLDGDVKRIDATDQRAREDFGMVEASERYMQAVQTSADIVRIDATLGRYNQKQKEKGVEGLPIIITRPATQRSSMVETEEEVYDAVSRQRFKVSYEDFKTSHQNIEERDGTVTQVKSMVEKGMRYHETAMNVFKQVMPRSHGLQNGFGEQKLEKLKEGVKDYKEAVAEKDNLWKEKRGKRVLVNGKVPLIRFSKSEVEKQGYEVTAVVFSDDDVHGDYSQHLDDDVQFVKAEGLTPPDHFFEMAFASMKMDEFVACYLAVEEEEMKFGNGFDVSDDVAKTMADQSARLMQYMEANKESIVAAQEARFGKGACTEAQVEAQIPRMIAIQSSAKTVANLEKYLQRPKKGSHTEVKHAAAKKMIAMLKGEKVEPFSKEEKKAFTGNVFSRLFQDFAKDLPKEFRHISPARTLQKIEAKFGVKAPCQASSFRRAMSGERAGATATSSNPKAVAARKDGLEAQKVQKKGGHQIRTPGKTS